MVGMSFSGDGVVMGSGVDVEFGVKIYTNLYFFLFSFYTYNLVYF